MLTVGIIFEIRGIFFFGLRDERLIWLWKRSPNPRSKAETDFFL